MLKLWQKNTIPTEAVERFTAGNDRAMDLMLAPFDVLGSLAHAAMLAKVGLLDQEELQSLSIALCDLFQDIQAGHFEIENGVEDVHSQIELLLTRRLGDAGKKIHTGRSRNDQVLTAIKLFLRSEIEKTTQSADRFCRLMLAQSERYKAVLMPGYTHFQVAMPSSFGLWFGAWAESLADDMEALLGAYRLVNQSPLGSAAGYGSSFPLDRVYSSKLLGFDKLHVNSIAAQLSRGKTERVVAQALANLAATLSKLANDCCLFMSANFRFFSFPDELTTGSSIMPHKKNPDVFEMVRAHCGALQALPNDIAMIINNLPSGYHRDFQLLKEKLFPAIQLLRDCFDMMELMLSHAVVRENILDNPLYQYVFSVEEVNRLVQQGIPFREAYRQIGTQLEQGDFAPGEMLPHTHLGSIGNLGNALIEQKLKEVLAGFRFSRFHAAEKALLAGPTIIPQ